jgi:hypothetical protein
MNSNTLILSSYDDAYKNVGLGQLAHDKNKEYADVHGYSYRCECEPLKSHYFFHKFILLQELLPKYDKVLWIDADAFLVNHSKKVDDFISEDPAKVFTAAIDQEYLNTGVFIIKNDPASFQILNDVVNVGQQINHPFPDAFVLFKIFEANPHLVNYIKPQKLFNAYKYELYKHRMEPNPDGEYEAGVSYVLHFPGMSLIDRVNAYHKFNVKDLK